MKKSIAEELKGTISQMFNSIPPRELDYIVSAITQILQSHQAYLDVDVVISNIKHLFLNYHKYEFASVLTEINNYQDYFLLDVTDVINDYIRFLPKCYSSYQERFSSLNNIQKIYFIDEFVFDSLEEKQKEEFLELRNYLIEIHQISLDDYEIAKNKFNSRFMNLDGNDPDNVYSELELIIRELLDSHIAQGDLTSEFDSVPEFRNGYN